MASNKANFMTLGGLAVLIAAMSSCALALIMLSGGTMALVTFLYRVSCWAWAMAQALEAAHKKYGEVHPILQERAGLRQV